MRCLPFMFWAQFNPWYHSVKEIVQRLWCFSCMQPNQAQSPAPYMFPPHSPWVNPGSSNQKTIIWSPESCQEWWTQSGEMLRIAGVGPLTPPKENYASIIFKFSCKNYATWEYYDFKFYCKIFLTYEIVNKKIVNTL